VESTGRAQEALWNGTGILGLAAFGVVGILGLAWWRGGNRSPSFTGQTHLPSEAPGQTPPASPPWRPTVPGPAALAETLTRDRHGRILPPDWRSGPEFSATEAQWQEGPAIHFGGAAARTHRGVEYSKTN